MVRPSASVSFTSPAGILRLFSDGTAVTRILLPGQTVSDQTASGQTSPRDVTDDILKMASQELQAWFNGELTEFTVPCRPDTGTTFQRHVWNELCQIPFGTTISYSRLASRIGRPAAVRAVGAAVGRNPLPILVPCHRVIGADGSLTGYAGGISMKQRLLEHESAITNRQHSPANQETAVSASPVTSTH